MYIGSLNPSHTDARKTSHSINDSSNEENEVDGKRHDQGEDESNKENEEEDDEEEQWMERALIEAQHREDGYDEEDDEEEQWMEKVLIETQHREDGEDEEEEPLLRRNRGEIIVSFAAEEEVTADYSNYSGHAGDESNSD
ncbi:hypothetical protein BGX33_004145, partial [Mortierella sp. NVP41]